MKRMILLLFLISVLSLVGQAQQTGQLKKSVAINNIQTKTPQTVTNHLIALPAKPLNEFSFVPAGEEISIGISTNMDPSNKSGRGRKQKKAGKIQPGITGLAFGSFQFRSDTTGHLATFENLNDGTGDGIKIKLGKTHPMWAGGSYNSLPNIISEEYDSLISKVNQFIDGTDSLSADDLIDLMPHTILAGSLINLTNRIIPHINAGLGLPISLDMPAELGLPDGLQLDILAEIGIPNGLIFDINDVLPPRNIGPFSTPPWTFNSPVIDFTIPSLPVVPVTTIIPNAPPKVLIRDTSAVTLIADLPAFTLVPGIPLIPDLGLPSFSSPNFTLLNVPNTLTKENEFLTFTDMDDRVLGRIRAQSLSDWRNDYLDEMYMLDFLASVVKLDLLGGVVDGTAKLIRTVDTYNKIGVEYSSGHGDYAEWLERKNRDEFISAGDIVAVEGGKITKASKNVTAEHYMVASHKPIMLGNAPGENEEYLGNKIAFMGQVPVKVFGPVSTGDFIVPHPGMDGYGKAVHPNEMDLEQAGMAVGRAWADDPSPGFKLVNTLVGIHNGNFINILKKNNEKLETLDARLRKIESLLKISDEKKPF